MADDGLVTALLDPAAYPHAVERVELIETHISWVFLAGERVYKVKKPVDLGFLDFTTPERRRFFCEEEVRLNRRLTHGVYLGVVELAGEVAVAMRRLPHERMLDRLVREGRADPPLLEEIGAIIARFHAAAATGGEIDELGGRATVAANWAENFAQTADLGEDVLPAAVRDVLRGWVEAYLDREAPRFAARVDAGRSRDCHGDLQAQHVCCSEPIQIFDCIEFNHRFRYGDTAAEIAFLAMDLDRLGRPDLAIRFLNAYLQESGDHGAVPLLDFYRAYRAFVRGKVLGFQLHDRPALAAEARRLFALAAGYAQPRPPPRLVVVTGVIASGKSTLARGLAAARGAILVRTDAVRKHLAGVPPTERRAADFGEGLYTPEMGARTYAHALHAAREALVAGWPVVLDGTFSTAARRGEARALAAAVGAPCEMVWCDAPDAVLAERLRRRAAGGGGISDAGPELLARHRAQYEAPSSEPDVITIDTTPAADAALAQALRRLRE